MLCSEAQVCSVKEQTNIDSSILRHVILFVRTRTTYTRAMHDCNGQIHLACQLLSATFVCRTFCDVTCSNSRRQIVCSHFLKCLVINSAAYS